MPTRAEVTAFSRAQNVIVTAAKQRLSVLWAALGDSIWDADTVRLALSDVFPALVADYGDAAATLAAEWFESQIGVQAVLAEPVGHQAALRGAYSALDPIFTGNAPQVLSNLGLVLDRMVKQAGRDTIRQSAGNARVRYARVPSGATTCGFCMVLASQGAVYRSEATASSSNFHSGCDCVVTPMRSIDDYPRGYDPDALYERYSAAANEAGTSNMKKVLKVMRETQGVK